MAADPFQPPAEFDDYVILSPLGAGKMGAVYLAEDTVLARHVAVKFIAGVAPSVEARQRFLTEARAAARVQHPNVLTVYRVGETLERPYLITEFVRGKSLADHPRPLPWTRALELGIDVSRGLAAAHRSGVVHRDIKAGNIMVTDEGMAKLVDFGLAALVQEEPSAAELDTVGGTPDFMAPEVWAMKGQTRRSDVYSVGAVLFELTAGRTPFADVPVNELPAVVQGRDAPPLAQVVAGVDPRFAAIVDRCLARDPSARFAAGDELREALETLQRNAAGPAVPAGNPYRGLRAFDAEHRALFFGRAAEIGAILDRLRTESFVIVTGDSGAGKSSICRAGVAPAVVEGALGGGRAYAVATLTPGRNPVQSLLAALADGELARTIAEEPGGLGRALGRRLGHGKGLLVIIDQLEELVTVTDPAEAARAEAALASLTHGLPGVRVLASLRADFLARFAALPALGRDAARALYFLRPLPPERLREVIVGPARTVGTRFESEAMVEALVAATAQTDGGLPLLQFALAELWEARDPAQSIIPAAALETMGGVAGALARHADAVIAGMPPAQRALAHRMLVRLVTALGTRALRTEAELVPDEADARAALDALIRGRLLVARDADAGSAYELAHEVLIQGWGTLRRWLAKDAQGRALRERVAAAAAEWQRLGRPSDAVWSARRLAEVDALEVEQLGAVERAFLDASRRTARLGRALRRGAAVGAVLLVAGTYAGLRFQTQRQLDREVSALAGEAQVELGAARAAQAEAVGQAHEAFARFDAAEPAAGEVLWARSLAAASRGEAAYGRASRSLEAALAKDARRDDVRALFAAVLFERAVIADADRRADRRDELVQRLGVYDVDGSWMRRWDAPAELDVVADPPARVTVDGEDRPLGQTPVHATLPRGAHVLVLEAPGRALVRYPILLARGARRSLAVSLPEARRVPDGFVFVPAGPFLFGAAGDEATRRGFFETVPLHEVTTGPYLIGRREVNYAEYLAFLDDLPAAERSPRIPSAVAKVGASGGLRIEPSGAGWRLTLQPLSRVYTAGWGEALTYEGRRARAVQDWRRLPVTGISADDAAAFTNWLRSTGRVPAARLCSELEWERGARGADDCIYPHGSQAGADDLNLDCTYDLELMGPDEVGSHPASRSPFGLDDMSGNAFEWTTATIVRGLYVGKGGSYFHDGKTAQVVNRAVTSPAIRDATVGMRVCADLEP